MTQKNDPRATWSLDREIVITRVIDAPQERVFQAWNDPTQISQWFSPEGFKSETLEIDIRPGGRWRFVYVARADLASTASDRGAAQRQNRLWRRGDRVHDAGQIGSAPSLAKSFAREFRTFAERGELAECNIAPHRCHAAIRAGDDGL